MPDLNQPAPEIKVNEPLYYVGIGASAGGLEALDIFFSHMPPDSGLAFIVIQHLSPDYKSLMVELLAKRTSMDVRRAEEGMRVEPNTVYLIPPRKQLTIFHGKLLLSEQDHSRGINLPIDVFLRSLADDQAEKAVAIILSGTGSDGVRGIRAVKEAGGMIMVQSEESAKFDGMPRAAISTGLADVILPAEEMPDRLLSFTKRPHTVPSDLPKALLSDEDGLARIFALLREQTRVDFTFYKPSTIIRRIDRRMTVNQINDLREYVRMLENRPGEVSTLYRELLIGVTSFFRDREVFDTLGEKVLPELLKDLTHREVRFWVAGCSTGEEAYSLAILAAECMEKINRPLSVKIFATDLDRDAIFHAGNGIYPDSIAADMPPGMLSKYFTHRGDHYQVQRFIREMVVFAQHNLVKDPPFTKIDLVSCRNLLIYLQPVLQQKVMETFNFSLNPMGILLLGTSETTGDVGEYFEAVHHKFKIYRSRGKKSPPAGGLTYEIPSETAPRQTGERYARGRYVLGQREEERLQERLLQSLVEEYVPLVAVVNERMELLHLVGDASGYLHVPTGKVVYDLSRMAVKELAIPMATGLQKVFQDGKELKYTNIRLPQGDGGTKVVQMRIRLLPTKRGQDPLAALFIEDLPAPKRETPSGEVQEFDISQEAEQRIFDLEQELQFTKENLQATIEELETSNEELQATNEELLASNEELQSTNEELQSVNEELHTVNAEYQSKIMELTEMTNDLDNLISATRVGTIFLDENLEIRRFTPEVSPIYQILATDLGRPLAHLTHNLVDVEPLALVKEVAESGQIKDIEVQTHKGEYYLMRVLPYVVGGPVSSGVVLTFTDIRQVKDSEKILQQERKQLLSIFDSINHIIYVADMDSYEILYANKTAQEAFGKDLVGEVCYRALQRQQEPCHFCTNPIIKEMLYQPYEWEYQSPLNDKDYQIVDQMIKWPDGRNVRLELAVDISERKQSESELQETAHIYRTLFETMLQGVVYHAEDGQVISANPAAMEMLGLTIDQMQSRATFDPLWRAVREDGSPLPKDEHPAMMALQTGEAVHDVVIGIFDPKKEMYSWFNVDAIPHFRQGEDKPYLVYTTFEELKERGNGGNLA